MEVDSNDPISNVYSPSHAIAISRDGDKKFTVGYESAGTVPSDDFSLYYGIATVIRLPAFVAALLGLALNYAAYESEIYRSALGAISTGQLEAARILGLTEFQVLRLVRGPQAFRLALCRATQAVIARSLGLVGVEAPDRM